MILWVALAGLAAPATARWRVGESAHFRVYAEASEAEITERVALLEDYRDLLAMATTGAAAAEGAPKLDVFIVDSMRAARPFGRAPANAAGFYTVTAGRIAAFAQRGEFGQQTLLHEYAHHFLLGSTGVAYPAWYVEGFAEYFATATFAPAKITVGQFNLNRARTLVARPWLPVERLLARRPPPEARADLAAYYAEAGLLTHYMFRTPAMAAPFKAYLRAVASGADPVAAFRDKVDPDLGGLERRLRKYLLGRTATYTTIGRTPPTPAMVRVTTLSPAADDLLLPLVSMELGLSPEGGAAALAAVRRDAARFPGDDFARRALAYAELTWGDRAAASTLLAALPADATVLRWQSLVRAPWRGEPGPEDRGEALKLLAKSYAADPADWRTLLRYVELRQPQRRPLTPAALDVALRARELAPQVPMVVVVAALALAQAERLPEAAAALRPLAFSPHGGPAAERAEAMLERAEAGDKAGLLALAGGGAS